MNKHLSSHKLEIFNLLPKVNKDDIMKAFMQYGEIKNIILKARKSTTDSMSAIVTFQSNQSVKEIREDFSNGDMVCVDCST